MMPLNHIPRTFDSNKTQVFLYVCPGNIPLSFAVHPWFVLNEKGKISRWEILFRNIKRDDGWGHLHKDYFQPFQGIEVFAYLQTSFWRGVLIAEVEGDMAERIAAFIQDSPVNYPYTETYSLMGPNSNTYAQWVLDQFPDFKASLPWNAFGKHFHR